MSLIHKNQILICILRTDKHQKQPFHVFININKISIQFATYTGTFIFAKVTLCLPDRFKCSIDTKYVMSHKR